MGTLQIGVRGDLAGILAISLKSKTPTASSLSGLTDDSDIR
jgi:hypothetical protein